MPDKYDPDLIGVKLTGRTRSQTLVAAEHLEADHWTASTIIWLKPVDKKRLLYRIDSVLSNMGGREPGRVALQSVRRAIVALPDEPETRAATTSEEADYLNGNKVIEGAVETEHGLAVPATIHVLDREQVSIGGFLSEDRSGGYADRTDPPDHGYRLLVRESEWYAGFGLCGADSDLWSNKGENLGTERGPNLWGYGKAGVIDNHGGTGADIEREDTQRRVIRCKVGDLFQIEDPVLGTLTYRLLLENRYGHVDRHNIMFERVGL